MFINAIGVKCNVIMLNTDEEMINTDEIFYK